MKGQRHIHLVVDREVEGVQGPPPAPPDIEALAHALFDILAERAAAGSAWGTLISGAEIYERATRMAAGGRA